ncbi:MAG: FlgD immunoglobulin-like domain containing protein [Endomicrobiaceae bacterium]|nr:FlgD immunoglobulin-like domain containing protein [Endomicrobiaceae bacterium]
MINKKNLIVMMFLLFFSSAAYCETKNFVSVLSGSSFSKSASGALQTSSFLGQPLVFSSADSRDLVSQSGFASSISKTSSIYLTFTNQTEDKVFSSQVVPVKILVKTSSGTITKIKYKIAQGEGAAFGDEITYYDNAASTQDTILFNENVAFTEGQQINKITVYAMTSYMDKTWSDEYTVKTQGVSSNVSILSPDPLTKMSTLDPKIETSEFDIKLTTVTVSLYKGNAVSEVNKLYSVSVSSTSQEYSIFNSTTSKISYLNSDIIKEYNSKTGSSVPTVLTSNTEYTLYMTFSNSTVYPSLQFTFKALGGGVADILTYPSPFNPKREKVKIRYLLANESSVTIKLYNKAGKIVRKLIQSSYEYGKAGTNEIEWDGKNYAGETLATGVYICEIIANSSYGEQRRYTALAIVGR